MNLGRMQGSGSRGPAFAGKLRKGGRSPHHWLIDFLFCIGVVRAYAAEPPVIPVGLDAYRQWERWPYQRIGARAYMRSTYDRAGGNEGADASHFLYQEADDFNVTLDVEGPGVLTFA